jgi:hypothetical protein
MYSVQTYFSIGTSLPFRLRIFPYERMDYRGDSELPRPVGQAWGTTG